MRPNNAPGAVEKKNKKISSPSPPNSKQHWRVNRSGQKHKQTGMIQKKSKRSGQNQQPGSMQEYFNLNKDKTPTNKKFKCQANNDYGENIKEPSKLAYMKHNNNQCESVNKLKFNKPKTVIGFDGQVVTIQPSVGRHTSENRSLQQWTEVVHKSQTKVFTKKMKPKSQPKIKIPKSSSRSPHKFKQISCTKIQKRPELIKQALIAPPTTKQNLSPPETEESIFPSMPPPMRFQPQNIKLLMIEAYEQSKQFCMNYLKRIPQSLRSEWIDMNSKICFDLKLSREAFFLSVELIDRYLNQQLILTKHKILALASLALCAKLDDRHIAKLLSQGVCHRSKKDNCLEETKPSQSVTQRYTQKMIQKQKKEQIESNMSKLLNKLHGTIDEQLSSIPSSQQIIEFQTLILLKENFKIPRNNISFWVDLVTMVWDNHLHMSSLSHQFMLNCLFLHQRNPYNYFCLTNLLQNCLHSYDIYQYPKHHLVFSSVFLICRISCQNKQSSFDEYRISLQKSNNLLFVDKFGVNAIYGQFLEKFEMQIGDILNCCRFISGFLESLSNKKIKIKQISDKESKDIFYRHFHEVN